MDRYISRTTNIVLKLPQPATPQKSTAAEVHSDTETRVEVEQPASGKATESPTDTEIVARLVAYRRQIRRSTVMAIDRDCQGAMHVPIRPYDPNSMTGNELRDSVIFDETESKSAGPTLDRHESKPLSDEADVDAAELAASKETDKFLPLTDGSYHLKTELPRNDGPDTWIQDGFQFMRLN